MPQAFHDIALFKHFTFPSPALNMYSMSLKTGKQVLYKLFNNAYFLLAVMLEGDESSQLRMAN